MLSSFQSLSPASVRRRRPIGQMCMCLSSARRWDQLPNNSSRSYGPRPRLCLPACKPSFESNGPGSRAPFVPSRLRPFLVCLLPCLAIQESISTTPTPVLLCILCVTYIPFLVSSLRISHYMNETVRNLI
jgi:hypothetical protein